MSSTQYVLKRNNSTEEFDVNKIRKYLNLISSDLNNIDVDYMIRQVLISLSQPKKAECAKTPTALLCKDPNRRFAESWDVSHLSHSTRISEARAVLAKDKPTPSTFILDILIRTASDAISVNAPDYQFVAARLLVNKIHRDVWGSYEPTDSFETRIRQRTRITLSDFRELVWNRITINSELYKHLTVNNDCLQLCPECNNCDKCRHKCNQICPSSSCDSLTCSEDDTCDSSLLSDIPIPTNVTLPHSKYSRTRHITVPGESNDVITIDKDTGKRVKIDRFGEDDTVTSYVNVIVNNAIAQVKGDDVVDHTTGTHGEQDADHTAVDTHVDHTAGTHANTPVDHTCEQHVTNKRPTLIKRQSSTLRFTQQDMQDMQSYKAPTFKATTSKSFDNLVYRHANNTCNHIMGRRYFEAPRCIKCGGACCEDCKHLYEECDIQKAYHKYVQLYYVKYQTFDQYLQTLPPSQGSTYNEYLNNLVNIHPEIYDPIIFKHYNSNDFKFFESHIKYDRDLLLSLSGIRQFQDKYLIQDRVKHIVFETPQEANMLIAMYMFMTEAEPQRSTDVLNMYDYLSTLKISLSTPVYSGVRGTLRSFSSCCVIDCGDTTDSILSTNYIIGKAVTKRYGIGVNINKIRGLGASISKGKVEHTGVVPFLRMFADSSKGFMQNGIRGGGATVSFPFWHWEVETMLELKNNKGVAENRIRTMDYSIGLNKLFFKRVQAKQDITLFSSEEVPLLSNDYTYEEHEFQQIYEMYERMPNIRKKKVNALEMLKKICTERFETGRIYVYFMDNMNNFGVFKESIYSSNLCQEIALPTKPVDINTGEGLVAVCILSCVNVGKVDNWDDMDKACDIIVRFLDVMIDYQEYFCPQIERSAIDYRPLGIGISDLFHDLAKHGLRYDTVECRDYVHRLAERFQYALLTSSCKLAKEKGRCRAFSKSKYSEGVLPIDRYKRTVDDCISEQLKVMCAGEPIVGTSGGHAGENSGEHTCEHTMQAIHASTSGEHAGKHIMFDKDGKPYTVKYECDWEKLRTMIKRYGLRNTCLSAIPPTASSCSISNSTPGIDPPRTPIVTKMSKYGTFKQVVPEYLEHKDYYTFQRDVRMKEYFMLIGVIQKFIDQGISTNSYYMHDDDIGISDIIRELTMAYSYGLKSLYYLNSNKGTDNDVSAVMSNKGICHNAHKHEVDTMKTSQSVSIIAKDTTVKRDANNISIHISTTEDEQFEDEDMGCAGGACKL